ncbi:MAG TPA: putative lipid II flippase FtsW [Candidatus Omnitrophica bacterium]|nr:putative lipid II flippase FtsW [Candidatus Omnitrophota bacterium]
MSRLGWRITFLTATLVLIGLLVLYSSSGIYAQFKYQDSFFYVKKQLLFAFVGFIFAVIAYKINLDKIRLKSRLILFLLFLALLGVLIIGNKAGGAKRWYRLFGFSIQPIEFAKLAYVFYLSDFLERRRFQIYKFKRICLPVYIILIAFVLVLLLQPDFGNAMFLIILTFSIFYFVGVPLKFLTFTALGISPFLILALWKFKYIRMRILGFLFPWKYSQDIGFQLIQSYIAIGSGGLLGKGLGMSRQKLFYLPQAHNDFIFSIVSEELGFVGAVFLISLYFFLVWNFIVILNNLKGLFARIFMVGLICTFSYQVVINLGVCLGLLPTKGLPLPFVSYGGSSLVANLILIGLILNLSENYTR